MKDWMTEVAIKNAMNFYDLKEKCKTLKAKVDQLEEENKALKEQVKTLASDLRITDELYEDQLDENNHLTEKIRDFRDATEESPVTYTVWTESQIKKLRELFDLA